MDWPEHEHAEDTVGAVAGWEGVSAVVVAAKPGPQHDGRY